MAISFGAFNYIAGRVADIRDFEIMRDLTRAKAKPLPKGLSPWRVTMESGSGTWSDFVDVTARSMFSAIEEALAQVSDEGGMWPYTATEIDIRVRRLG